MRIQLYIYTPIDLKLTSAIKLLKWSNYAHSARLPFSSLRWIILRPCLLFFLARNPCFLLRLIKEGWKVRFSWYITSDNASEREDWTASRRPNTNDFCDGATRTNDDGSWFDDILSILRGLLSLERRGTCDKDLTSWLAREADDARLLSLINIVVKYMYYKERCKLSLTTILT